MKGNNTAEQGRPGQKRTRGGKINTLNGKILFSALNKF
jgi:hypothetical protein